MTHPMKTLILTLALATGVLAAASPASAQPLSPGSPAPDFTLKDIDGKDITLSSFKGKIVAIDWANYECPFDRMHYASGNLPGLQKKYTGKGVVWLSIHSSAPGKEGSFTAEEMKTENARYGTASTSVLLDPSGAVARLYGAKTTPHLFVVGADGTIRYNGAIDSIPSTDPKSLAGATPYAANALDALLAGTPPNPAATQPYGCSIKYASTPGFDKR